MIDVVGPNEQVHNLLLLEGAALGQMSRIISATKQYQVLTLRKSWLADACVKCVSLEIRAAPFRSILTGEKRARFERAAGTALASSAMRKIIAESWAESAKQELMITINVIVAYGASNFTLFTTRSTRD
ncbi:MAG: hypothetical protein ACYDB1_10330 [Acidiferrobacteraceae bacterium]